MSYIYSSSTSTGHGHFDIAADLRRRSSLHSRREGLDSRGLRATKIFLCFMLETTMESTEARPGNMGLSEAGQEEDQKVVVPVVAPQAVEGGEQQPAGRGVKRTRRDRGTAAKERISKMPPCAAGKRSSIYRGVTRHRWTGRYEAHLWDKSTWNQSQNKKGKQVYLGAYDEEEAAARAYDLAALKYWGAGTLINFPLPDYARDSEEMQNVTREEYLASLRRKSSGFSRGVSKYRGVARHHHNGRWEARIGRVFGNKYLYLGTYSTQEEAAAAYDMAAIEYRGLNAVTNFDLSRYIRWLRPGQSNSLLTETDASLSPNAPTLGGDDSQLTGLTEDHQPAGGQQDEHQQHPVWGVKSTAEAYQSTPSLGLGASTNQQRASSSPTALSLLLQSTTFKQMLERTSAITPTECDVGGSSISSSYPSSEISLGVDHQQHQQHQQQQHVHHSQLHSQQQSQDNNAYYSSWGKQSAHQQNQMPTNTLDMQDPIETEGSVHGHESSAYHQRYRQQILSMTSNQQVRGVVGQHYSNFQDQMQQRAQQNYNAELHRQQHVQQSDLAAAYGHGYTNNSVPVSNFYSDQDSGGSTIEDSSFSFDFTNLLPLSTGTITC